ncbi:large ribosomal subunit protein bL20-like [Saccostrea echinata]|uniref:large ribosomal subunit protein bL20-like n=1 Tax=Saccostrea echinata TaxID=191078 RepID=UPI002A815FC9|nr:large ribosomal subunit protein bL20-like [Saccostrea echinata]
MVFLSRQVYARLFRLRKMHEGISHPDRTNKKNFIFRLTWHFYGRRRNCYAIAVRAAQKMLQRVTRTRKQKKMDMKEMWIQRLSAALAEHDMEYVPFMSVLAESDVQLDKKVLHDICIYEPRTFQGLVEFAKQRHQEMGLYDAIAPVPEGIMTRSMFEKMEKEKTKREIRREKLGKKMLK